MTFENDFQNRYVDFKKARNDINTLATRYKRFKQVLTGIQTFLQSSAHNGKLTKKRLYLYQTNKQSDTPSFKIYYIYDEKYVRVYHIRVAEEDDLMG
jgi:hypothetical protein